MAPTTKKCYISILITWLLVVSLPSQSDENLDTTLRALIQKHRLTGQPLLQKTPVDIHSPLAQLGKRLFFSFILGGNSDSACVSCHHPALGGGDNLPLSIGVDAVNPEKFGPGRKHSPTGFDFDGGPTVPRNSPTTFNTVFYSRCMFWDCRIESLGATPGLNGSDDSIMRTPDTMWGMPRIKAGSLLQAQVAFPVISENEMRAKLNTDDDHNEIRDILAYRIRQQSDRWLEDFQKAFQANKDALSLITFENISLAIEAYEASQIFIHNPWHTYVKGKNNAISDDAKQGAILFFADSSKGGYACAQCHVGDFFTDEAFHVTAIPQIGRGKKDGPDETHDYGRFVLSGDPVDKFAFRTPNLLNIEVTGPYGHTGAYRELRDVIRHMLNPAFAIKQYDFSLEKLDPSIQKAHARENTQQALDQLQTLQKKDISKLTNYPIKEANIEKLYQFLLTLTDPCVKQSSCLAPWIE